jgi:hypothetical protein
MRKLRPRRALVAGTAALALAGGGGAAIAATQGSAPSPNTFLDSVAKHLGISSDKLKDATRAAAIDQVDAALKAGKITKEQADQAKEKIESGKFPPFGGPGLLGGPGFEGGGPKFLIGPELHVDGPGFPGHGLGDPFSAAAKYLDLSVEQLRAKLRGGKSLADLAKAEGKSVDGLEQAILDDAEKQLDKAVGDKDLTAEQAKTILDRLKSHVDNLVNGSFGGRPVIRFRGRPPGLPPFVRPPAGSPG